MLSAEPVRSGKICGLLMKRRLILACVEWDRATRFRLVALGLAVRPRADDIIKTATRLTDGRDDVLRQFH
jgi:hypothetical protein